MSNRLLTRSSILLRSSTFQRNLLFRPAGSLNLPKTGNPETTPPNTKETVGKVVRGSAENRTHRDIIDKLGPFTTALGMGVVTATLVCFGVLYMGMFQSTGTHGPLGQSHDEESK